MDDVGNNNLLEKWKEGTVPPGCSMEHECVVHEIARRVGLRRLLSHFIYELK